MIDGPKYPQYFKGIPSRGPSIKDVYLMVSVKKNERLLMSDLYESTTAEPFDITRWEQLNPWLKEGQADDRMPMHGSAGDGNGSLSVRRSNARRTHQLMYKEWSQARHD
jgi:hypothetical protein